LPANCIFTKMQGIMHVIVAGIDTDLFAGVHLSTPFGARGVYGGQVASQSLCAACHTVDEGFTPHSLHCFFLKSSDGDRPIVYRVHRIRTGRSYATRWIIASQGNDNVFASAASFHAAGREPSPISH